MQQLSMFDTPVAQPAHAGPQRDSPVSQKTVSARKKQAKRPIKCLSGRLRYASADKAVRAWRHVQPRYPQSILGLYDCKSCGGWHLTKGGK